MRIIQPSGSGWICEEPGEERNRSDALMRLVGDEARRLWRKAILVDMFDHVEAIGCAWANRLSSLSRAIAVWASRIAACAGEC